MTTSPVRPPGWPTGSGPADPGPPRVGTRPGPAGPPEGRPGAAGQVRRPRRAAEGRPRLRRRRRPTRRTRAVPRLWWTRSGRPWVSRRVVVPGTAAVDDVLPKLPPPWPTRWISVGQIADQVEEVLDAHPLAEVLTSMPGVWGQDRSQDPARSRRRLHVPTTGHLAAYAGLAPVTRRSGTSIRGEHPPAPGNKHLKRAFFLVRVRRPARRPRSAAPTTTANEPKARSTTPPSSASPAAAATSCTPCSATTSPTNPKTPQPLDFRHRDTPPDGPATPGRRSRPGWPRSRQRSWRAPRRPATRPR